MTLAKTDQVAAAVKAAGVDALLLVPGTNLYYTLGIKQMIRLRPIVYALFPDRSIAALLPKLEAPNFRAFWPDAEVVPWTDDEGPESAAMKFGSILRERAGTKSPRLAAEYYTFRLVERSLMVRGLGEIEFVPAEGILNRLRMVKDRGEVEAMREACRIAEVALERVMARFERGMTEIQLGNQLKIEMLALGSEEFPKEPVVSSGPRTAFPHTKSTDRPIGEGDALMIDTGARYHGYTSDITRTFFVGTPPEEFVRIYELELRTSRAVLEAIRPGVTLSQLDELAHRIVDEAGYGPCFMHRVGHGLGMDGHEEPSVVTGNPMVAVPGLTFTVEPCICVQGFGGVRVEENVAVSTDGVEVLTSYPRELRSL